MTGRDRRNTNLEQILSLYRLALEVPKHHSVASKGRDPPYFISTEQEAGAVSASMTDWLDQSLLSLHVF